MKQGYAVINLTTYDDGLEIFGVYRSYEKAERVLKRVKRERFGNMSEEEINEQEIQNGESYYIKYFEEHFN